MKKNLMQLAVFSFVLSMAVFLNACSSNTDKKTEEVTATEEIEVDYKLYDDPHRFADLKVIRYKVGSWEKLTPKQKELVYYLSQAALSGRDIIYAQNYRNNLSIRRTLEEVYAKYPGNRDTLPWKHFEVYLKRIWFSNGVHHHYSEAKIQPGFSDEYLAHLIESCEDGNWPIMEGETVDQLWRRIIPAIFAPELDAKKVVKTKGVDLVKESANNYYSPEVTQEEAEKFYADMKDPSDETPVWYGLNSRLVKEEGQLVEKVYATNGLYGDAIKEIVKWLTKASEVAENDAQKKYIDLLIKYYQTGSLEVWDECNIAWVNATEGDIDFINGFIEVYGDALGHKASYESVIEIKDFDASQRMAVMAENAQWFEDQSPIMDEHKKAKVVGVSYKVVDAAMEGGDCSPSTPIGINLPNSNWIRKEHGSKSVSLGNIVEAYNNEKSSGVTEEFYLGEEAQARRKAHAKLAGKLHTAMHEVIGHASGKINPGIGTPKETLKNYSNTLEEARADLVALYYVMDQKLVDLGLTPSLEVGKAEYDGYITNGLMIQLRRLKLGEELEEDHMRNRQLVAKWAYEKGKEDNVIEFKKVDGKTYVVVNDYEKLRELFGQLLREIQRIKSEGDYEAAEQLVEGYGVKVDEAIHKEVLDRFEALDLSPYSGFIQPRITMETAEDGTKSFNINYSESFTEQMVRLSSEFSFLKPGE